MPRGTTGDLNGSLATLQGDLRKIKYGGDLDVHRCGPHSEPLRFQKLARVSCCATSSALDGEGPTTGRGGERGVNVAVLRGVLCCYPLQTRE